MNLFLDINTNQFVTSAFDSTPIANVNFTAGDVVPVNVGFVQNSSLVTLPSGTNISLGFKQNFTGSYLAYANAFALVTGQNPIYSSYLSFANSGIASLVGNGSPAYLVGQLSYSISGVSEVSSRSLVASVQQDINTPSGVYPDNSFITFPAYITGASGIQTAIEGNTVVITATGNSGGGGNITASQITDSTALGRTLITSSSLLAAQTALSIFNIIYYAPNNDSITALPGQNISVDCSVNHAMGTVYLPANTYNGCVVYIQDIGYIINANYGFQNIQVNLATTDSSVIKFNQSLTGNIAQMQQNGAILQATYFSNLDTWIVVYGSSQLIYSDNGLIQSNGLGQLSAQTFAGAGDSLTFDGQVFSNATVGNANNANYANYASSAASASSASNTDIENFDFGNVYSVNGNSGSLLMDNGNGSNLTSFGMDDSSTPTNSVTPVGWIHTSINGSPAWVPYYQ